MAAIYVEGNKAIPTSQVLRELQTRVGRPFDPTLVQRDVRKLASRSWFVDVQPVVEKTPRGRVVTFKVVERPVIRYVQYLGNEGIADKKLAKETGLTIGGSVDPYTVEEARRKLLVAVPHQRLQRRPGHGAGRHEGDRPRHRVRDQRGEVDRRSGR